MEERGLMNSQIYNSAWEAQNKLEGEEPVSNSHSNAQDEELQNHAQPVRGEA